MTTLEVDTPHGLAKAHLHAADQPRAVLVLGQPGPMGFQPSVFDFDAGAAEWSPYWDHFTYTWTDEGEARVLTSEDQIHTARDNGELEEFPGMPETEGMLFTVNCPVPVLAPPTFDA